MSQMIALAYQLHPHSPHLFLDSVSTKSSRLLRVQRVGIQTLPRLDEGRQLLEATGCPGGLRPSASNLDRMEE